VKTLAAGKGRWGQPAGRRVRGRAARVRVGATDSSLSAHGGLLAVGELVERLGVVESFDTAIEGFKVRERGLSAGQFLVGLACCQLTGGDFLVALDRLRADEVAATIGPVPTPASTTAAGLARRFGPAQRAGIEKAVGALSTRVLNLLPRARREALLARPSLDMDMTEVEVYGRAKDGTAYNYLGQRSGRPHAVFWAETATVLAADLLTGREDPRAGGGALLARAVAGLPAGCGRPRVRMDSGYFSLAVAEAVLAAGCDFSIGVTRNPAAWRAVTALAETAWVPARGMPGAQVAVCDYAPKSWPPGTRCLVRRVRHEANQIGVDPRARRRGAIPVEQLTLALDGHLDAVFAYSFIVTNIECTDAGQLVELEAWHRRRTDIEDRFRDAKHGAALRHLPSGDRAVNTAWMWGALLGITFSAWLQELTGLPGLTGRAEGALMHLTRLRRELINIPARLISHGRRLLLRLPANPGLLPQVLARLRKLPYPA